MLAVTLGGSVMILPVRDLRRLFERRVCIEAEALTW
jgi:hypothetical protein